MAILIDTQWNVKGIFLDKKGLRIFILIDTQWNVKAGVAEGIAENEDILIDTQWNVNALSRRTVMTFSDINRYIVECKSVL